MCKWICKHYYSSHQSGCYWWSWPLGTDQRLRCGQGTWWQTFIGRYRFVLLTLLLDRWPGRYSRAVFLCNSLSLWEWSSRGSGQLGRVWWRDLSDSVSGLPSKHKRQRKQSRCRLPTTTTAASRPPLVFQFQEKRSNAPVKGRTGGTAPFFAYLQLIPSAQLFQHTSEIPDLQRTLLAAQRVVHCQCVITRNVFNQF